MHAQLSSWLKGLVFSVSLNLLHVPYFVYVRSEGSGETPWTCRLVKYQNLICWPIYKIKKNKNHNVRLRFITRPSIYGVIVYFLLCHESLNYSTGQ